MFEATIVRRQPPLFLFHILSFLATKSMKQLNKFMEISWIKEKCIFLAYMARVQYLIFEYFKGNSLCVFKIL